MTIDIVWDTYLPDGLKESTGEKRSTVCKGVCRKVRSNKTERSGQTKLPDRWIDFLYDSKSETII